MKVFNALFSYLALTDAQQLEIRKMFQVSQSGVADLRVVDIQLLQRWQRSDRFKATISNLRPAEVKKLDAGNAA
jgi:hypothetical protein